MTNRFEQSKAARPNTFVTSEAEDLKTEVQLNVKPDDPSARMTARPPSQRYDPTYGQDNGKNFFSQFEDEDLNVPEVTNTPKGFVESMNEHFYNSFMQTMDWGFGGILGTEMMKQAAEYKNGPMAAARVMEQYKEESQQWEEADWFYQEPNLGAQIGGLVGGLGGAIGGTVVDPSTWAVLPIKIFQYMKGAAPTAGHIADTAISYGATNALYDIAGQGAKNLLEHKEGFDVFQTMAAGGLGAAIGGPVGYFTRHNARGAVNHFAKYQELDEVELKVEPPNPTNAEAAPPKPSPEADAPEVVKGMPLDQPKPERSPIPEKILDEKEGVDVLQSGKTKIDYWKMPDEFYDVAGIDKQTYRSFDEKTQEKLAGLFSEYKDLATIKRPPDIIDAIRTMGGIKDETGELKVLIGKSSTGRGSARPGVVNNKTGLTPDAARRALVEQGYLKDDGGDGVSTSSLTDLYDAIDENMRGTRRYSSEDLKKVEDFEAQEQLALEQNDIDALASFAEYLVKEKHPQFALHADEVSDAARLYRNGVRDPDEMMEQLAMLDLGPASKAVEIDDDIQFSMKPGGRPKRTQPELIEGGKITMKEYLQKRADGKLSPTKAQEGKESLGGLFGDDAKQTDLVDRMRQVAEDDILTRGITKTVAETARVITRREFDTKPPTIPDMVSYATLIAKKDTSFMKGRFPQRYKQAQGLHYGGTGSIRLKSAEDFPTAIHEIAHSWEKDLELGPAMRAVRDQFLHEIGPLDYFPQRAMPEEGFAEFMRYYVTNPNYAIKHAPGFLREFEAMLKNTRPQLMEQLKDLRAMYAAYLASRGDPSAVKNVISKRGIGGGSGRQIVDEVRRSGMWGGVDMMVRRVYTAMVDRQHPINKAVNNLIRIYNERAENKGLPLMDLKASDDAYKLARLSVDAHQAAHVDMMHGTVLPGEVTSTGVSLNDAVTYAMGGSRAREWNGERMDFFEEYLVARRMADEWGRHLNGDLPNPPHSAYTARDWLDRIEFLNNEYPEFHRAAQMIYSFQRHQLLKEYNAGLLDDAQFMAMDSKSNYVPFYRDMTEFGKGPDKAGGGPTTSATGKYQLHRQFRGSDKDVHRPLENIMRQTFTRNTRIAQNEVFKKLADLATRVGHGGASIMTRIPERELKRIGVVSPRESIMSAAKEAGIDPGDAKAMAELVEDLLGPDARGHIFRNVDISERGDRIIYVWRNGMPEAYQMGDTALAKEVHDTLTMMGNEQSAIFTRVFAGFAGGLRAGVVTSPDFAFANFIRDQLSAWVLSDVGYIPFASGIRGIKQEVTNDLRAQQYAGGGGMSGGANVQAFDKGGLESMQIEKLRKKGWTVNKFSDLGDFLNPQSNRFLTGGAAKDAVKGAASIIEVSETGTRLGLFDLHYKKGLKEGLTEYEALIEAAFEARDYIDFGRYGSRMNAARKILTFMNAGLQGTDKSFRTLLFPYFKMMQGHPLTAREQRELARATKGLIKVTSLGIAGLTLESLYNNDEWYNEANEYYRKTHWLIPYGNGNLAVIPKPFELGLMSNLFQEGFQYFHNKDPLAWSRLREGAYEAIVPPLDNPGYKTITEIRHNYNEFTESPIVPSFIERGRTPENQYNEYTSNIAFAIANKINKTLKAMDKEPISPMYVDHALTGLLGSWGRSIQNFSNGKGFSGDWTRDWVVSRFLKEGWRGASSSKRFWGAVNNTNGEWKQVAKEYKDRVQKKIEGAPEETLEGRRPEVVSYSRLMGHFEVDYKRMHPMYRAEKAAGTISKLRRQVRKGEIKLIEGDDGETYPLAPDQALTIDNILGKLSVSEVRNALIATQAEGWAHRQPMDTRDYWEQLKEASPEVYEEARLRYEDEKVLPEIGVRDSWPEAHRRLLVDGEKADLDDLLSDAEDGEDPGALE